MRFDDANDIMRGMRRLSMAQRGRKTELLRVLDLSPGQDVVLMELALAGAASQNELAVAAEVDEPSVGRSLVRLQKKGLVKRTADPEDARRRVVTLTPKGEALIPELRKIYVKIAREAVGGYRDFDYLRDHLNEISSRLGRHSAA